MKAKDITINQGGLMRCCIDTIQRLPLDKDFEDGYILNCMYEGDDNRQMILDEGVWRWNREGTIYGKENT